MQDLSRIDKESQYYLNKKTGAVINKSVKEYTDYKMKVDQAKELEQLKDEVISIKSDLTDIKTLLQKALSQ